MVRKLSRKELQILIARSRSKIPQGKKLSFGKLNQNLFTPQFQKPTDLNNSMQGKAGRDLMDNGGANFLSKGNTDFMSI